MRGMLLSPAQVPILLVFEDPNPRLWEEACAAWASLNPVLYEDVADQLKQVYRLIVLGQRPRQETIRDYISGNEVVVVDTKNPAQAAETLTVEVTMHMLKELGGELFLLHAAALGDPGSDRALALVAASGTGKTTASRFLGQHFVYLSDESAVVEPDELTIRPYPKPLSVIETKGQPKVQKDPATEGLALAGEGETYRLQHLVVLNRVKDRQVEPSWQRVDLRQGLFDVILQSSAVQRMPGGLADLAGLLNRLGGVIELTYSEIADTLPFFQQLLAGQIQLEPRVQDYEHVPGQDFLQGAIRGRLLYQRGRMSEGLALADGSYLLTADGRLSEVSVIAWDLWNLLAEPLSQDQLFERASELYGEIPREDFEQVVRELVNSGILGTLRVLTKED